MNISRIIYLSSLSLLMLTLTACSKENSNTQTIDTPAIETENISAPSDDKANEEILFPVRKDGQWGYINKNGELVVKPQFNRAFTFSNGLGRVGIFGKGLGFINSKGEFVIKPHFDEASDFSEGLAAAKESYNGKAGYINKAGQYVIKPHFDSANAFSTDIEGLAIVQMGKKYLCIDKTGKIVKRERQYKRFAEGLIPNHILPMNKFGYSDKEGRIIIEPRFDDATYFCSQSGLARVVMNGKYGYIDKAGNYVIKPQFDYAEDCFTEGMSVVNIGGKWTGNHFDGKGKRGYVDSNGKIAIEPKFDRAESFNHGLALIEIDGKIGYIDKTGKYIWEPTK